MGASPGCLIKMHRRSRGARAPMAGLQPLWPTLGSFERRGASSALQPGWRGAPRDDARGGGGMTLPLRLGLPLGDEVLIRPLGLLGDRHLLVAQRLDVVGVGGATLVPLLHRPVRLQLEGAQLVGDQRRPRPEIVGLLDQEMPDEDGHLTCSRDRGELMAASSADAQEEGVQGAGCLGRRPGGLDQQRPRVRATDLADPGDAGPSQAPTAGPAG